MVIIYLKIAPNKLPHCAHSIAPSLERIAEESMWHREATEGISITIGHQEIWGMSV
jgi:hypothetical protein